MSRRSSAASILSRACPSLFEQLEYRQLMSLAIFPIYDSSLTSDPNFSTISASIGAAIQDYQQAFTNNLITSVRFVKGNPGPNAALSNSTYSTTVLYSDFRAQLAARATTADAQTALGTIPTGFVNPLNNSPIVRLSMPHARALGFNADSGQGYDATITCTYDPNYFNLSRSAYDPNKHDLKGGIEHELDEVLGFGSSLDTDTQGAPPPTNEIKPDDLFRYDQNGQRTYNRNLSQEAYFSFDGGTTRLARFYQQAGIDFGDWSDFGYVQGAAYTGITPELGLELRRLNILGYQPALNFLSVTNSNDYGVNSLRSAIHYANAFRTPKTISFNIPGSGVHILQPLSSLQALTNQITIDGTSEPGYSGTPLIQIDGANMTVANSGTGINIQHGNSTVQGLALTRWNAQGIYLGGTSSNITIRKNYIGVTPFFNAAAGNNTGILVSDGVNFSTIGGSAADQNVISSNTTQGIRIDGSVGAVGAGNITVSNNLIGVSPDGQTARGNQDGIYIDRSSDNVITNNTIARNSGSGIYVTTGGYYNTHAERNLIQGNRIGVDALGVAAGNGGSGVNIRYASNNSIDGTTGNGANIIANNASRGITIYSGAGNSVHGNSIYNNGSLGIDLGDDGVTPNDSGDTDSGANNRQNFPNIWSASSSVAGTKVTYRLGTQPGQYRVDLYWSPAADSSGYGEGQNYLGSQTISVSSGGQYLVTYAFSTATAIPIGSVISATATRTSNGDTSEFSYATEVTRAAFVVTNTEDSGAGSLRQAILNANADTAADTIIFNIPANNPRFEFGAFWINVVTGLPAITQPVSIDGSTQTAFTGDTNLNGPEIEIRATGSSASVSDGLIFDGTGSNRGDNCTLNSVVIDNFGHSGVWIPDGFNNTIAGCYIGTTVYGLRSSPNHFAGVAISGNASWNHIDGCLIGGNGQNGVDISANATFAIYSNVVENCWIGFNPFDEPQESQISNTLNGVYVTGKNVEVHANLIRDNHADGVRFDGTIGDAMDANSIIANSGYGVALVNNAHGNLVGGPATTGFGNEIRYNGLDGVGVLSAYANTIAGNTITNNVYKGIGLFYSSANNVIGGATADDRNIISSNNDNGISVEAGSYGTRILGNYIGTDSSGTSASGNALDGIFVAAGCSSNIIGGTNPGEGNVISGNRNGVLIVGNFNTVQGNLVGTNAAGTAAIPNSNVGVALAGGASFNTIGGSAAARNLISGNMWSGAAIFDDNTNSNTISANYIGTDITGTLPLGNHLEGIFIGNGSTGPQNNSIGFGNTIAFNTTAGVRVAAGVGNSIVQNSIFSNGGLGIDLGADGVNANDLGDGDSGANTLQNYPVITSVVHNGSNQTTVTGTINTTANSSVSIDLYDSPTEDASGFGEGKTYLANQVVQTDASGNASFSIAFTGPTFQVSATASVSGSTSEFSKALGICWGFAPSPSATYSIILNGDGSRSVTLDNGAANFIECDLGEFYVTDLAVSSGTYAIFDTTQHIRNLTINNAVARQVQSAGANHMVLKGLAIAGNAYLEMEDNDLILDYSGASQLSAINALIASGRNGGAWNGAGIRTEQGLIAPQITTLGAMEATDYKAIYGNGATFNGESIDNTAVLVKYTYYGDTDFSGSVDFDDYVRLDNGFNNGRSGWINGDVNGDGQIDFDDYVLTDASFNQQGAAL